MKIKIIFIVIVIGNFFLFNCYTNDSKKYLNNEALFYFNYPKNIKISQGDIKEPVYDNKYELNIKVEKISNIEKEMPLGYDYKTSLELQKSLNRGNVLPIDINYNTELVKIDNIYGQKYIVLSRFDITDINFKYVLIFFNNDYRIILTYLADAFIPEIIKKMPSSFNKVSNDLYEWVDVDQFAELIKQKKICSELIEWDNSFNEIIKSIKIQSSNIKISYISTIDNLRFRETPTLDGKFIRMLNKNDKLELLEKGKEETINGTKGTWVKVKTEKGEVGWCFDAYLKEVK